jgi:hypothetical protein
LVAAAAQQHDVHVVVATGSASEGGEAWRGFAAEARLVGAASLTHLDLYADGRRRPARDLVADITPVLGAVDAKSMSGVLASGLDLAPFALGLSDWLGVPLVLDSAGDYTGMLVPDRPPVQVDPDWYLAAGCVTEASLVMAASSAEAEAVDTRFALGGRVAVLADAAPAVAWQVGPPKRSGRVLFRADLTEPVNIEAARWLVEEVLPHLPPHFSLDLVGPAGEEMHALVRDGVQVHGPATDLLASFQFADVAVAPQRASGRGREQVLEAFVHRRAVVASPTAADGLEVTAGVHLRVGDAPEAFALAVVASAQPKSEAAEQILEAQVAAAFEVATTRHDPSALQTDAASLLAGATGAVRPASVA